MKKWLLFLLNTYVLTLLMFVVAKAVFMLCNGAGHDVGFFDFLSVIAHGLSLDLSTALYVVAVPLLVALVSVWVRLPKWILLTYFGLVAVALAIAFVADTSLYAFWGFKLDASFLQYLEQPEGITQSVSAGYLLLRMVAVGVLAVAFFVLYCWGIRGDYESYKPYKTYGRRWAATAIYVLLMPLMAVGIRGGLGESTTNIGQVYYSQNQFLNHSAVNPVFSFLSSLGHQAGDLSQYHFMDESQSDSILQGVYTTESLLADTLLNTQRPHTVIVILLESAGEEFSDVMPRLQQLKLEGVNFRQCYANSWRTDRGTVCALSGYPSFPSLSVMKMPQKSRSLPALARSLSTVGYRTSYLYGGDINFTNMRSYLIGTGWQQLVTMDDFTFSQRHSAQWGVRDDITFDCLFERVTALHDDQPRLYGFSTLSSHEPWDVPVKKNTDEVLNAFAYLDDCIGSFVDRLKQTPLWDSLLIVFTADHGIKYQQIDVSMPKQKNHIPMLWVGGAVAAPRIVDVLCNQSDLPATLLGQMGISHDDYRFSRDVLSATYTHPVAVHNYSNAQWICDSTGHQLYDFDACRFIISESTRPDSLLLLNKAVLQSTTTDLESR